MKARLHAPTPLPEPEASAAHAWAQGWWSGIAVGAVCGLGLAVLMGGLR